MLVKVSGENDVGFSEVGQHVDPLHQRGQPLVDHLKEDDAQAVYVHFLEKLCKNTQTVIVVLRIIWSSSMRRVI